MFITKTNSCLYSQDQDISVPINVKHENNFKMERLTHFHDERKNMLKQYASITNTVIVVLK